jgi:hypothetical protein
MVQAMSEVDVVMNCSGPYHLLGVKVLKAAIEAGKHFVDYCDDVAPTLEMLALSDQAKAKGITAIIGFVGLIVPHLMRLVVGSDHRILLPAAAMFGGLFLVLSDTLARTVLAPRQLPVGVVTALLGVPLFLLLLNRARVKQ